MEVTKKQEDESDLHVRMDRDGRLKKLKVRPIPREDDFGDGNLAEVAGVKYLYLKRRDTHPPMFIRKELCDAMGGFNFAKQIQRHLGRSAVCATEDPRPHMLLGMNALRITVRRRPGYYNAFIDPVPSGS